MWRVDETKKVIAALHDIGAREVDLYAKPPRVTLTLYTFFKTFDKFKVHTNGHSNGVDYTLIAKVDDIIFLAEATEMDWEELEKTGYWDKMVEMGAKIR